MANNSRDFLAFCCTEVRQDNLRFDEVMALLGEKPESVTSTMADDSHNYYLLACYLSDNLAGAIMLTNDGSDCYTIHSMHVHSVFRNLGVGSCLLGFVENFARIRGANLIQGTFQPEVLPFYSKCGFRPEVEIRQGNTVMQKKLAARSRKCA